MWHDFLNALVWLTFPNAKRAFHRRQHAAIERSIPAGATHPPNARTREQDALALIDEGGVLMVEGRTMFFGHALYEGLVSGQLADDLRAGSSSEAVWDADPGARGAPGRCHSVPQSGRAAATDLELPASKRQAGSAMTAERRPMAKTS